MVRVLNLRPVLFRRIMTETVAIEQVEETLKSIEQLVLDKQADQALEQLEALKTDNLSGKYS